MNAIRDATPPLRHLRAPAGPRRAGPGPARQGQSRPGGTPDARTGLPGVHRRRLRGCTRRDQAASLSQALVERTSSPRPRTGSVADITQHRTSEGWLYLAVVLDCFTRRVVGWARADHIRSELVGDAMQMAIWNPRPAPDANHHSDHGSTYTSWAFGHRPREAGHTQDF